MGEPLTVDQLDLLRRERLALSKLTQKQKLFCEAYCRTFDKVDAMKAGGYWLPKFNGGKQDKLIEKNFQKIMQSESVSEYIMLLKQSAASRLDLSLDAMLEEYKAIAFANMDDYVSWDADGVTIEPSADLTRAQKAGILEIIETTTKHGTTVRIKLHNKQAALDKLFGILKELEEKEAEPEGPAKISQTQINFILQDPVKRRAIEHLAEGLFDRRIRLVGTDKDRLEFDKNLERIMLKIGGPANERNRGNDPGGAGKARGAEIAETKRIGHDAPDLGGGHSSADVKTGGKPAPKAVRVPGDACGDPAAEDTPGGPRYDIDGL